MCVGLGNPGQQYAMTRHNVGFMAVDTFAKSYDFPDFKKKFQGELSERRLDGSSYILLKPLTYMNLSGSSVQAAMAFYKLKSDQVVVFHDDLDLVPGQIKVKFGGGAGGHNGLKSLDQLIGNNYWRVRIGIGHPGVRNMVTSYVLSPFLATDHDWLVELLQKLSKEFPNLALENPDVWLKRFYA
jgi:PTH1 family peptidyl-tRNA hydrolase